MDVNYSYGYFDLLVHLYKTLGIELRTDQRCHCRGIGLNKPQCYFLEDDFTLLGKWPIPGYFMLVYSIRGDRLIHPPDNFRRDTLSQDTGSVLTDRITTGSHLVFVIRIE